MIDKEKTIFVGSVDAEGFPNIKAMLPIAGWSAVALLRNLASPVCFY